MTHICVGKLTIIDSDNGLSPGRHQAIIWTNARILLIGPLGTNFIEMLIKIHTFSFRKMHLKMSSAKWRPFCLGLNVLNINMAYLIPMTSYHISRGYWQYSSDARSPKFPVLWGFQPVHLGVMCSWSPVLGCQCRFRESSRNIRPLGNRSLWLCCPLRLPHHGRWKISFSYHTCICYVKSTQVQGNVIDHGFESYIQHKAGNHTPEGRLFFLMVLNSVILYSETCLSRPPNGILLCLLELI